MGKSASFPAAILTLLTHANLPPFLDNHAFLTLDPKSHYIGREWDTLMASLETRTPSLTPLNCLKRQYPNTATEPHPPALPSFGQGICQGFKVFY
jgi:hypothetical protein